MSQTVAQCAGFSGTARGYSASLPPVEFSDSSMIPSYSVASITDLVRSAIDIRRRWSTESNSPAGYMTSM